MPTQAKNDKFTLYGLLNTKSNSLINKSLKTTNNILNVYLCFQNESYYYRYYQYFVILHYFRRNKMNDKVTFNL